MSYDLVINHSLENFVRLYYIKFIIVLKKDILCIHSRIHCIICHYLSEMF